MSNWQGYLFKAVATNQIFPMKYIAFDTWESTPNQREEVKAYRDDYTRKLTRITASGKMSTFSFTTIDNLHLADKMAIQKFFTDAETDHIQRNIILQFWNEESNSYTQGVFYQPNPKFKIKRCTDTDIIYKERTIELIQAEDVAVQS